MAARNLPTRLELRRLKRVLTPELPLLRVEELDQQELELFTAKFVHLLGEERFSSYATALEEWGVACPHPLDARRKHRSDRSFDCSICGCVVVDFKHDVRRKKSVV